MSHHTSSERTQELAARVRDLMPGVRSDLESLTRIPSVSLDSFDQRHVEDSAETVADLLRAEGLEVEIVREGGRPAVIGHRPGPEGAPTVLLYAHHDVQPPGDDADWDTPVFEPTLVGERLYARGVADDKAGVMAHVAALRAHGGRPPVGVTVFVEGEEEIGSDSLPRILERHGDKLACDAIVLADSHNWKVGVPALTTTLRGLVRVVVEVRALDHGVHSGLYGGAVPDGLTALCRLLATLHDDAGDVAVPGLMSSQAADLDYSEEDLRADSGLADGVSPIGTGSLLSRLWTRPSMTVIGIDAPTVDRAANLLMPVGRAKLSMRIHPAESPRTAYLALKEHLESNAPWGCRVSVSLEDEGDGFAADAQGPVYDAARSAFRDAWDGVEPVDIGVGGSIPFVAAFAERFPQASILVTGVEDPDTRAHAANESLHLGEFERVCAAEALLLDRLGRHGQREDEA
ncbi:dipeptidase [Ornithinimicrobium sp. CNJ-824]|uniref:dipeptidase n=1 Tax=Ornithinimicrobium sp. CNJ-824 TaxID=1904966 RepID=UPI000967705D|nr:dipeptidase [Ornithinimicrobium sp. CNJ-824]OLT20027.1 dipeptidase [Ornithinimicrobium sp. CNJ-824]